MSKTNERKVGSRNKITSIIRWYNFGIFFSTFFIFLTIETAVLKSQTVENNLKMNNLQKSRFNTIYGYMTLEMSIWGKMYFKIH